MLTFKPGGDGLVRIAIPEASDDLLVVAITPKNVQDVRHPFAGFPESFIPLSEMVRNFMKPFIFIVESCVVSPEALYLSQQVILVCLGMRLVDAIGVTAKTPATWLRSNAVTLEVARLQRLAY